MQLLPETLYLTCSIIDRFLEKKGVLRKRLQLVCTRRQPGSWWCLCADCWSQPPCMLRCLLHVAASGCLHEGCQGVKLRTDAVGCPGGRWASLPC